MSRVIYPHPAPSSSDHGFLFGDTEMASRMHQHDWSASPLGEPATWSPSLKTVVGLMLHSKFPMFIAWGADLGFLYNDPYIEVLGDKHPAALGQPFQTIWNEIWPDISPLVDKALAGEATYWENLPLLMRRKGFDEETWFTFSYSPLHDENGKVAGVFCACTETTAQVKAEKALRESEARSNIILESITDAFFAVDRKWRFVYANQQAAKILGREHGSFIGHMLWEDYPGLIGSEFERVYRRAAKERVAESFTAYYPDHDRWYEVHVYPTPNEAREGLSVYFRDVTESKKAEEELQASQAGAERQRRLYEAILTNTPDFGYVFSLDHKVIYANDVLLKMWGKTWDEAIGKGFLEIGYEPWHAEMHSREIDQVAATKQPLRGQVPFDGTFGRRIYDYIFVPVLGVDGLVEAVAGTTRDVTEQKEYEAELRANEARRSLLLSINDRLRDLSDPSEMQVVSAALLGQHLQSIRTGYAEISGDDAYVLTKDWCVQGVSSIAGKHNLESYGTESAEDYRAGRMVAIEDFESDPRTAGLPAEEVHRGLGIRAQVVVPLVRNGRLTALLFVHSDEPRRWTVEETALIREVAERTWTAVERARAEAALHIAKDQAVEANSAKSDFLANMSHEIRTPLNAVVGIASLLERGGIPESKQLQFYRTLRTSADSLLELINDLLDISKIEQRDFNLVEEPFGLDELLADVTGMLSPRASEKGIRLEASYDAVKGWQYAGDKQRLRQVLMNVIGNAVKFTESGNVTVAVHLKPDKEGCEGLEVEVTDTGIGIPEEMVPRLFQKFSRGGNVGTIAGTGLGLAITKHLVEMMGGAITVESEVSGGTKVSICLPGALSKSLADRIEDKPHAKLSFKDFQTAQKILLVEDYPANIAVATAILDDIGVSYDVAHNGREALTLLECNIYGLVLMDVNMPEVDGLAVTRQWREKEAAAAKGEALPIVAMTAHALAGDRDRCLAAGMDDFLAKPVTAEAVFEKIRRYL